MKKKIDRLLDNNMYMERNSNHQLQVLPNIMDTRNKYK
jgi:hypothetical protein